MILALDIATKTGWCLNGTKYGTIDLKSKHIAEKMLKLADFLIDIHNEHNIKTIVYERISGGHKNPLIHASKLLAIVELFCYQNNIELIPFSAKQIKLFGAGSGNASKQDMIDSAKEKYNIQEDIDDNTADALHLYYLSKSKL